MIEKNRSKLFFLFKGVFVLAMTAVSPLFAYAAVIYYQPDGSQTIDQANVAPNVHFTATASGAVHGISFYAGVGAGDSRSLAKLRMLIYTNGFGTQLCDLSASSVVGGTTVTDSMTNYVVNGTDLGACNGISFTSGSQYEFSLVGFDAPESHNVRVAMLGSSSASYNNAYLWLDTGSVTPPITDTHTRVDTVTPPNGTTIATSTSATIGATGYVNVDNLASSTVVTIHLYNQSGIASNAVAGVGFAGGNQYAGTPTCPSYLSWFCGSDSTGTQLSIVNQTFTFPVTSSGTFSFSTTTSLVQLGRYSMDTTVSNTSSSFFGFFSTVTNLAATSTSFTASTTSKFDLASDNAKATIAALANGTPPSCTIDFSTIFDLSKWGDCLSALFNIGANWAGETLKANALDFLHRFPWGYATRVVEILTTSTATTTLPSIAFTLPNGVAMQGHVVDFTPWTPISSSISTLTSATTTATSTPFMATFEYWWNTVLYVLFAFWLVRRLWGIGGGDFVDEKYQEGKAELHKPRYKRGDRAWFEVRK